MPRGCGSGIEKMTGRTSYPTAAETWAWAGSLTSTSFQVVAQFTQTAQSVALEVSQNSGMSSPVFTSGYVVPTSVQGDTISYAIVKLSASGLQPRTKYYWRVRGSNAPSQGGTIRSLTTAPAGAAAFTFVAASCSDVYPTGSKTGLIGLAPAFRAVAQENPLPLFFLHMGDWTYTDAEIIDIGYQRDRCARAYISHPDIAFMHQTIPIAIGPSDHDWAGNDCSLDSYTFGGPSTPSAASIFANSRQAFDETVPHYSFALSNSVTQVFDIGKARFLLLDAYSASTYVGGTALGSAQLAWLQQQLNQAATDGVAWLFISHGMTWTGAPNNHGFSYSAYTAERQAICDMIETCAVLVCLLVGDAHCAAADDGGNTGFATDGFCRFPQIMSSGLHQIADSSSGPYSWNGVSNKFFTATYSGKITVYAVLTMTADNTGWTAQIRGGPIDPTTFAPTTLGTYSTSDATPAVSFDSASMTATHGSPLTVNLDKTWFGACSANWASSDGQSGSVAFLPNKSRASFNITFAVAGSPTITLSGPSGCTISGTNPAAVTVT